MRVTAAYFHLLVLHDARVRQQLGERLGVRPREAVERPTGVPAAELHEPQARQVGARPDEFRVQRKQTLRAALRTGRREGRRRSYNPVHGKVRCPAGPSACPASRA